MSFCGDCKLDICNKGVTSSCCGASSLYGMLLFARRFDSRMIQIASEYEFVVDYAELCLLEFGINPELIEKSRRKKEFQLKIEDTDTIDRLFFDFGYTGSEYSLGIKRDNFMCDRCIPSFIAGCFLGGGSVGTPKSGYHLEFISHHSILMSDLKCLLEENGFSPKEINRGYSKVLYFKDSEHIEDLLTFIGAQHSALELMNEKIIKDIRNSVNRRTNCESANIDKIVKSSEKDVAAINRIYSVYGKDYLNSELSAIASARIENPELSIEEIGLMMNPPLSKSGANHRFRKLRAIAAEISVGDNNG